MSKEYWCQRCGVITEYGCVNDATYYGKGVWLCYMCQETIEVFDYQRELADD